MSSQIDLNPNADNYRQARTQRPRETCTLRSSGCVELQFHRIVQGQEGVSEVSLSIEKTPESKTMVRNRIIVNQSHFVSYMVVSLFMSLVLFSFVAKRILKQVSSILRVQMAIIFFN